MSKVVSGIGKAVKGIVSGVVKVFKKIVKSKIFKVVLVAAAIYFGGAALGAWNSGFASVDGALTAAGSQASQAAAAASTGVEAGAADTLAAGAASGAEGAAGALLPGAGVEALGAGGGLTVAPTAGQLIATNAIPTGLGGTGAAMTGAQALAPGAGVQALGAGGGSMVSASSISGQGILERLVGGAKDTLTKTAGFVDKHPYATAMGLNAAASAFSPNQEDLQNNQYQRDDLLRQRQLENLNVGSIKTNLQPSKTALRTSDGTPVYSGGFLNTALPRNT